jgi:predicted ATP-grasp superfamily ATP-dependent carboligase
MDVDQQGQARGILVLDGNERSALAVTRSLGRRGLTVFVGNETRKCIAEASRYCASSFVYPSPAKEPQEFVNAISRACRCLGVGVLFPLTDFTMPLVLRAVTQFKGVTIPFGGYREYCELSNKCSLIRKARQLGIPAPESVMVRNWKKDQAELAGLAFPVVIKPCLSVAWHDGRWIKTHVTYATSRDQLRRLVEEQGYLQRQPFLLQRCTPGTGAGVFALCRYGEPLAVMAHRRVRQKPPWGGVSVLSETVPAVGPPCDMAERLLRSCRWHGAAMVEFKIGEDGTPYLMEVNARLWGSLQLAIDAGVDFPFLLYKLAIGDVPQVGADYSLGVRNRWLLGDLDNLIIRAREAIRGSGSLRDVVAGLGNFAASFVDGNTRCEVNRLDDLGPFWCEIQQYIGLHRRDK